MISLIWAMDENRVIGLHNQLPWRLPEDLKFFKRVTMGHPIAMGRKTYESIGKPLPGRENIVITRDENYSPDGCVVMNSIEEFMKYAGEKDDEVFVIGGAEIFKEVLPKADRLYLTMIHEQFEGDTFFPVFDIDKWELETREIGLKDEKNPYDYEFLIYKRK
ncbi:dihydrofolate reductase [Mesobacillus subterraneus]|jgi:dihydrofolate reductase|uniref:dihydrofolate reductase n=1 Tax=Mesobacillus subterraneus TaxID=285983 RepID=UPI002040F719|nr:dihydrofolate reductase [Mesobacillus subterraneus]MCM3664391.1 dihydrofolate reductase [Mesobacillus subterraneus]MCM3682417.1 dihydrofolate reductase [Mesobacillus subterraneus]